MYDGVPRRAQEPFGACPVQFFTNTIKARDTPRFYYGPSYLLANAQQHPGTAIIVASEAEVPQTVAHG